MCPSWAAALRSSNNAMENGAITVHLACWWILFLRCSCCFIGRERSLWVFARYLFLSDVQSFCTNGHLFSNQSNKSCCHRWVFGKGLLRWSATGASTKTLPARLVLSHSLNVGLGASCRDRTVFSLQTVTRAHASVRSDMGGR